MCTVGEKEAKTQKRVAEFFLNALDYAYLGFWKHREHNSNVEETHLADWLKRQGHDDKIIAKVLQELEKARGLAGSKSLYDANRAVYDLLRYGVKVKPEQGKHAVTVWLIDWKHPENNHFAIAEEVTVQRRAKATTKRPGHRALRQRHRARRAGTEALDRFGDRGHPPEPRQPEEGRSSGHSSPRCNSSWRAATPRACATA